MAAATERASHAYAREVLSPTRSAGARIRTGMGLASPCGPAGARQRPRPGQHSIRGAPPKPGCGNGATRAGLLCCCLR
eukprot:12886711-Prorocentrum_lima.AAC.1